MDPVFDWLTCKDAVEEPQQTRGNAVRAWHGRELGIDPRNHQANKNVLENHAEDTLVQKPLKIRSCELPGYPRSTFLMVFSPDGTKVASTHGNHNVYVSELASGKHVRILRGHPRTPWCIAFHPSHPQLIGSGCLGGEVRVWDITSGGSEVWNVRCETVIASIAFHPRDQLLVIATYNELYFWDWSQPAPYMRVSTNSINEKVRYVAFDSLGYKLITGISLWSGAMGVAGSTVQQHTAHAAHALVSSEQRAPEDAAAQDLIVNSYQSLVHRYDSLVRNYQRLFMVRHRLTNGTPPPTIDRGTDPMETDVSPGSSGWTRNRPPPNADGTPSASTSQAQDGGDSADGDSANSRLLNFDVLSIDGGNTTDRNPDPPFGSRSSAFQPLSEGRAFRTVDQSERSTRLLPNPFSASGSGRTRSTSDSAENSANTSRTSIFTSLRSETSLLATLSRAQHITRLMNATASASENSPRPTMTNSSTQISPSSASVDAQTINESLDLIRDILRDSGTRLLNLITNMSISTLSSVERHMSRRDGGSGAGAGGPAQSDDSEGGGRARPPRRPISTPSELRRDLLGSSSDSDSSDHPTVEIHIIPSVSIDVSGNITFDVEDPTTANTGQNSGGLQVTVENQSRRVQTVPNNSNNEPGQSSRNEETGTSSRNEDTGTSSRREETRTSSINQETGTSSRKENLEASSRNEEPGPSSRIEKSGSPRNEEIEKSSATKDTATSSRNTEPWTSSSNILRTTNSAFVMDVDDACRTQTATAPVQIDPNGRMTFELEDPLTGNIVHGPEYLQVTVENHSRRVRRVPNSSNNQEPETSFTNEEPGTSTRHEEPGTSSRNERPGTSTRIEVPETSNNEEPGLSSRNEQSESPIENEVFERADPEPRGYTGPRENASPRPSTSRENFWDGVGTIPPAEALRKVRIGVISLQKLTIQLASLWVRGTRPRTRELRTMWENLRRRILALHRETGRQDLPSHYTRSLLERCMMLTDMGGHLPRATPFRPSRNRGNLSDRSSERNATGSRDASTTTEPTNTANDADANENASENTSDIRPPSSGRSPQARAAGRRSSPTQRRILRPTHRSRVHEEIRRRLPEINATRNEIRMRAMQILSIMFNMMMMCLEERGLSQLIITMLKSLKKSLALTCLMLMMNRQNANRANNPAPPAGQQVDSLSVVRIQSDEHSGPINVDGPDDPAPAAAAPAAAPAAAAPAAAAPAAAAPTAAAPTAAAPAAAAAAVAAAAAPAVAATASAAAAAAASSAANEPESQPARKKTKTEKVKKQSQSTSTDPEIVPSTSSQSQAQAPPQKWSDRVAVQIAAANRNNSVTARDRRELYLESRRQKALHKTNPKAHPIAKKRAEPPVSTHSIPELRSLPRRQRTGRVSTARNRGTGDEPVAGPSSRAPPQSDLPGDEVLTQFANRVNLIRLAHLQAVRLRTEARNRFRRLQSIRIYNPSLFAPLNNNDSSTSEPASPAISPSRGTNQEGQPSNGGRRIAGFEIYRRSDAAGRASEEPANFHAVLNNVAMPLMQVNELPANAEGSGIQPNRLARIHEYLQPIILAQNALVVDDDNNGDNGANGGASARRGTGMERMERFLDSGLIPETLPAPIHRVQAWDFTAGQTPEISNSSKNVVVQRCRIHNDASIDISKDGRLLVALLPVARLRNSNHWLGVYSLEWARLGQCLHTAVLEHSAVSVALSPTARHLAVGLGSRRFTTTPHRNNVFALLYRLDPLESTSRTGLSPIKELEQNWEDGFMSLNCLRWAPQPGQGLVYANNTGQLIIMS